MFDTGVKLNSDQFEGFSYDCTSYTAFSVGKWNWCIGTLLILCNRKCNNMSYFRSAYLSCFFHVTEHLVSYVFRGEENCIYQPYYYIRNALWGLLSPAMRPGRHCLLLIHFNCKSSKLAYKLKWRLNYC